MSEREQFFALTPERVLEAVESAGLQVTGRCQALNSFENRVYEVELESDTLPPQSLERKRIAKFYRPGRWTREQILEEHAFLEDLVAAEIPAVAPVRFEDGSTLRRWPESGIYGAVFPKVGGRAPDELTGAGLRQIGRLLARIHAVGEAREARGRPVLDLETYGRRNLAFLLERGVIPIEFESRYRAAAEALFALGAERGFDELPRQRIHGDCHLGNVLAQGDRFAFVDFDDCVRGPVVQDLWLLIGGEGEEARSSWSALLEGYESMREFDRGQLRFVELLRGLRFVHYAAWIARRWEDPAFPLAFPQFGTYHYWKEQTEDLERQARAFAGAFGPKPEF